MPRERKSYKKDRLIRASKKPATQNLQEHFSGWQKLDKLPDGYSSLDDLTKVYNAAISGGMSPAEAREDLKIKFNIWKRDKKTNSYVLDNRIIRTELDPFTRQLIDLEAGDEAEARGLSRDTSKGAGQTEASRQRREFNFGVPEEQARLAESNIFMPRGSDAKIYYHKGHLWAAADDLIPGSDDAENVWPELGDSNSLHRDKPRYDPNFMEAAGVPRGKADAYYNRKILESGAPRASGLYGAFPQQILDSLDRLIYTRAQQISSYTKKSPYDVWELATRLDFQPELNEGFPIKSYDQAIAIANEAQSRRFAGENPDPMLNQLAGTTSVGDSVQESGPVKQVQEGIAKTEDYGKFNKRTQKQRVGPTPDLSIRGAAGDSGGSSGNSNILRIARNTAPMWASLPLGAAVLGQSAHAAVTNPNADTIETALWDGANLVADGLSLVPIPMVAAGAEGAQKILGITQAARQGQKFVQQQGLTPQPPAPRPAAVPQAQSRPRTATAARTQGQMMPKPLDIGNEIEFRAKQVRGVLNRFFPPDRDI